MAATKRSRASVMFVMAGAEEEAEKISRALIEENLAACANIIGPVRSIYRWQGKVEDAREYLIMIKTRTSLTSRIERAVGKLHSYEVPEIIALPIAAGSTPYLEWIAENTAAPKRTRRATSKP